MCVRVRACVCVCVATSIPVFSIAFTEVLSVEFIATIIKASATKYSYIATLTVDSYLVSSIVSHVMIIPSNLTVEKVTRYISSDLSQC